MKRHRCILDGTKGNPTTSEASLVAFCLVTGLSGELPAYEDVWRDGGGFDARAIQRLDMLCRGAIHEVDR